MQIGKNPSPGRVNPAMITASSFTREITVHIPHHAPPNARRRVAVALFAFAALAVLILALALTQRPAHATARPSTAATDTGYASAGVVPGGTCDTPDVVARHGTERYRCWQKPGEDCPHWHWVYNPDTPKSTRTAWVPAPCTTCSATPTPPAPSTPAPSTPLASSPAPPAAVPHPPASTTTVPAAGPVDQLPVTGDGGRAPLLAGLGAALVAAGGLLRWRARRPEPTP